jgi:phosphoribosylglycinamide formyltransferase-1
LCSYRATRLPLDSNTRLSSFQRIQRILSVGITRGSSAVRGWFSGWQPATTMFKVKRVAVGHRAGFFHERGQHAGLKRGEGAQSHNSVRMKNIVILISGSGSNMAAIVRTAQRDNWRKAFGAQVAAVISNRPDAAGLALAREHLIATEVVDHKRFATRDAFDAELATVIDRRQPTLVVLAGFMRILTPAFVARYEGRLVNIHPSLLPAFAGLDTHQRAIDAGCKVAGATVHRVTPALDHGPILAQAVVPVLAGDTAQTLGERVLTQEHLIYPHAIAALLRDS